MAKNPAEDNGGQEAKADEASPARDFAAFQPTLSLRPTQFSIGLLEVEYKVVQMRKLSAGELARQVDETPIPVILSPWGDLCLIDHHHYLFACWHAGVPEVRVRIVEDYTDSKLSFKRFWASMARRGHAYLQDQFGEGPRSPVYLPIDVRGMADDPYRSLAWMVRKEGGYANSDESFAEFQWANFFRAKQLLSRRGREGFHEAVQRGLRLARSKAASALPGYRGKADDTDLDEGELLRKSKYVPKARAKGELASKPVLRPS
jgi:hypothetical protein